MKCSYNNCKKKAEFYLPNDKKKVFCEDHAILFLKKGKEVFLARIKTH